ncbi:hypothetical protein RJD28_10935 [Oscillospiraceae bacterium NTUH-002-81]|nr:hypothetical protein RJD28_10935 [Oscillospiraceae bacterium NTUH-002-81]
MKKQNQWGKIQTEAPWQTEESVQPKMQKGLEGSRKPEEEKMGTDAFENGKSGTEQFLGRYS